MNKEWYDAQYSNPDSFYRKSYDELPTWAKAINQYHVDYVIALMGLYPARHTILDLGSGMGHYIEAWENRGYRVTGLELSSVAIELSGRSNIVQGSVADLSMFPRNNFDVVFSAAVLEHISPEDIEKAVPEMYRVARNGAHFIGHDRGHDPSHINIQTPLEWQETFKQIISPWEDSIGCYVIPNMANQPSPAFIHVRDKALSYTLRHAMSAQMEEKENG